MCSEAGITVISMPGKGITRKRSHRASLMNIDARSSRKYHQNKQISILKGLYIITK